MNVAIVGLGKMGKFYDGLLSAKYVVDIVPLSGRVVFPNIDEFIAYHPPVDFVVVASPTRTHFSIAKKLLSANYHVLVEKPVCISSLEARELELRASDKGLMLYQSTLERYNPLVKFLKDNIATRDILKVESYRFGKRPESASADDAKFDLGIHDVDLWFYLFNREIEWKVHAGYGAPQREIKIFLRDGRVLVLDLLQKFIRVNGRTLDFSKASSNNPILEMTYDLFYQGKKMNECWSSEIEILEEAESSIIELSPRETSEREAWRDKRNLAKIS